MNYDCLLDTSNLRCPEPILKARQQLRKMQTGQVLKVIATDPLAEQDFAIFCKSKAYDLLSIERETSQLTFYIQC